MGSALQVSRLYPRAGPAAGGTSVTIWGNGFRDLSSNGALASGLHCSFGSSLLIPASRLQADKLLCLSPAASHGRQSTIVRVSVNGNNPPHTALSLSTAGFIY